MNDGCLNSIAVVKVNISVGLRILVYLLAFLKKNCNSNVASRWWAIWPSDGDWQLNLRAWNWVLAWAPGLLRRGFSGEGGLLLPKRPELHRHCHPIGYEPWVAYTWQNRLSRNNFECITVPWGNACHLTIDLLKRRYTAHSVSQSQIFRCSVNAGYQNLVMGLFTTYRKCKQMRC